MSPQPCYEDHSVAPRIWLAYLAVGGAAIAAYYVLPSGGAAQAVLLTTLNATAAACAIRAAVQTDGRARVLWSALAAAMVLMTLGNGPRYAYPLLTGRPIPFPSPVDVLWLAAFPCSLVALGALAGRLRSKDRRDDVLDALILALGGGSLMWAFVVAPVFHVGGLQWPAHAIAVAYPSLDLLVFAFLVRLAVAASWRNASLRLLLGSIVALLVGDTVQAMALTTGSYRVGGPMDGWWMVSYLLVGAAALHLSAGEVVHRKARSGGRLSQGRVVFLAAAVLTGPLLVAFNRRDLLVTASVSALTSLVVIIRMTDLNRELVSANAELGVRAATDPLTGLSNRVAFYSRLGSLLATPLSRGRTQAVLFVDLDDFKDVNDTLGHAAGDALLRVVGERLREVVRDGDCVARLGGDEFALLLVDLPDVASAQAMAERAMRALAEPVQIERHTVTIAVSVGIAVRGPRSARESLVREADVAMYTAKGNGKNQVAFFDAARDHAISEHHALKADIAGAAERGELVVEYQPIVELTTGSIVGVEALVRWQHPTRGLLPPSTFIELAEQNGSIVELGYWVLEVAAQQMHVWHQRLPIPRLMLSVNVSGRQLDTAGLADRVGKILERSGLAPTSLILEVTESLIAAPDSDASEALNVLRALGVKVAIDDFGSGYSSLAYLRRLPIDILKIDRSFVSKEGDGGDCGSLLAAIVAMSRPLGLDVIAEGIEETSQLTRLQALGVPMGQGFLLSKPVSAAVLETTLLRTAAVPAPRGSAVDDNAAVSG